MPVRIAGIRLPKPGARTTIVLRWTLSLALLAVVLHYLDIGELRGVLSLVNWPLAVPVFVGLAAIHLINMAIWRHLTVRFSGIRLGWVYATKAYYAGQAIGTFTPSNVGSDLYRAYSLAGRGHRWETVAAPLILHRAVSYVALLTLGLVAMIFVPLPDIARIVLISVAGCVLLLVLLTWKLGGLASRQGTLIYRVAQKLHVSEVWKLFQRDGAYIPLGASLGLALCYHLVSVFLGYLLVLAVNGQADMLNTLAALMIARSALLLPISVSGLGFQEGATAALFPLLGLSAEIGLVVSLLARVGMLLTACVGVGCMLISGERSRAASKPATDVAERR